MNFLTLVLSLMLICSFSLFVLLEKEAGQKKLRATYLGHMAANQKILKQHDKEIYDHLPEHRKPGIAGQPSTSLAPAAQDLEEQDSDEEEEPEIPPINPECARLNLWPLIQEGREEHPLLYNTTLKLLKTLYGHALFDDRLSEAKHFLDVFLRKAKEAQQKEPIKALEKLSLGPSLQMTYYCCLKGMKDGSYPSLLDVVKVEETPSKVCLQHAHPDLLAVFFGEKAASKIYAEIHKENARRITETQIEQICHESHVLVLDPAIFDLLEIHPPRHPKMAKTTRLGKDKNSQISLRKTIYTP